MKLSLILEAIDRWSKPVAKAAGATKGLNKETEQLGRQSESVRQKIRRLWNDTERGERIGTRVGRSIRGGITTAVHGLGRAADRTILSLGNLTRAAGPWLLGKGIGAVGLLGAAATAGFGLLSRNIITTAATFEQLEVQLETQLGSQSKARDALAFITKFATDTPYEVQQVTEAFIAAKQNGIDPFSGSMTTLGDAASGMNKDFVETIKAVGDASRFQYERLVDLGVTASTKGSQVTLSYFARDGKLMTQTVKKNALDIQKAVLGIFGDRFSGGMKRQSQTFNGILANLSDAWTNFELQVAQAGIFDLVKNDLRDLLAWTTRLSKNGEMKVWAQWLSDKLKDLWEKGKQFVNDVDWAAVGKAMEGTAKTIVRILELLGKAYALYTRWQTFTKDNPINISMWGPTGGILGGLWNGASKLFGGGPAAPAPRSSPYVGPGGSRSGAGPWKTSPRSGGGSVMPGFGNGGFPAPPGGHVKISLSLPPGVEARTTGMSGNGLSIETGRAMGGFA